MSESTKPTLNEAECGNKSKPLLANRILRFRVWDKISKQMYRWSQIASISLVDFELEHYTLMQFTGVKDKKGVDIYEGDKIKYKNLKGYLTIVFENGAFGYYGISCFITLLETNIDYIEVIGNVFQDSE